jgi:hypothetical protein
MLDSKKWPHKEEQEEQHNPENVVVFVPLVFKGKPYLLNLLCVHSKALRF